MVEIRPRSVLINLSVLAKAGVVKDEQRNISSFVNTEVASLL